MKKQVLDFINKSYLVDDDFFIKDRDTDSIIYANEICNSLSIIFFLDEKIIERLLREWYISKLTNDFDINWKKVIMAPNKFVTYEPKKKNRFLLNFPVEFELQQWIIFEATRPSMRVENDMILWDDLTIKLRDPIGPSTSQKLMELIHPDINNNHKVKEVFNLEIEMLDPTGVVVERWCVNNCNFKSIDFGSLSTDSDDLVVCTLVISVGEVILLF